MDAREQLDAIAQIISTCTSCRLHNERRVAVPGAGLHDAALMIVGESPGTEDDIEGKPLIGDPGERFDQWLEALKIPRDQLFLTSLLKCRPPKNRFPADPGDDCAPTCAGYLRRQIALVNPAAVVLLGKHALQHVLLEGTGLQADPIQPWIGKNLRRRDRYGDTRFTVLYHPAYLLRNASEPDEELCLTSLGTAWHHAQAKRAGRPPAVVPFEDIATAPTPLYQSRSLFREERPTL